VFALVAAICHWHIAIGWFKSRVLYKKERHAKACLSFLVREAGLELLKFFPQPAKHGK